MAENEDQVWIDIPPEHAVSAFATGAVVRKPREMVFFDFAQLDTAQDPPERARIVGRLVVTAAAARDIRDQLAELLPDTDTDLA
jgi:hypothetical protein